MPPWTSGNSPGFPSTRWLFLFSTTHTRTIFMSRCLAAAAVLLLIAACRGAKAEPAPRLARLDAAEPGRLHRIRLEIRYAPVTIAQDVTHDAWTFGGTVPGPALHVRPAGGRRIDRPPERHSVSRPILDMSNCPREGAATPD
jgi:hypothetical protein